MASNAVLQVAMTVKAPARMEKGMQESDLLDQLPNGEVKVDDETAHIRLVSLGCTCGPKLSFKHMGRGAETLPFDWMRTRHEGLVHFLRNDFEGFFEFNSKHPVPGCGMTTFRGHHHSFWHDDPTDPGMLERYERRIKRFQAIDASVNPVLFVRAIPTTDEILLLPDLLDALIEKHGANACLVAVVDFQHTVCGAVLVKNIPNLLVYYLGGQAHAHQDGETMIPPYCDAIAISLDWAVGRKIEARVFDSLELVKELADETTWGLNGTGNLLAFELRPEGPEEEPFEEELALPADPPDLPLLPSSELEKAARSKAASSSAASAAAAEPVLVVPLGNTGLVKDSILRMGLESEPLPFDWLRVSFDGLLHFLSEGFKAPIRDGLGGHGQRPRETEGFFDIISRKAIPGTQSRFCRTHLHSFWHDDPAQPEVRARLAEEIQRFEELGSRGQHMLFVRVAATHDEVKRAEELVAALRAKFGKGEASLLLICDFQSSRPGPKVVEGMEEELLVYLLEADAHKNGEVPYERAIRLGLEWMGGEPVQIGCVKDLESLTTVVDPTHWGLIGPQGLRAFNRQPPPYGVNPDSPTSPGTPEQDSG